MKENEYILLCIHYCDKCFIFQKSNGSVRLNHFELKKTFTFLDYIMGGTQINCTFAIDFTGKIYKHEL